MDVSSGGHEHDFIEAAVISFQSGKLDESGLARSVYPTIRRFAKVAAHGIGIADEAEDLVQTLWVMFIERIAREYDPSQSIYPYLTTFARNLARNALWQRQATPPLPPAHDREQDEELITDRLGAMWHAEDTPIDDAVSRKRALAKVAELLSNGKGNPAAGHGLMPGIQLVKAVNLKFENPRRKPAKARVLSPDQKELIHIRTELGMTQPEFADYLNINVPRLSSWEYGRTSGVPEHFMNLARDLLKMGNKTHADGKQAFGNKSMSEILAQWAQSLGVDVNDNYELAQLLQVSEPTIRRWRDNEVKPRIAKLVYYQGVVNKVMKAIAIAKK